MKDFCRRMGLPRLCLTVLGLSLCMAQNLPAQTFVNRTGLGGSVQDVTLANATWSASGSPYVLEGQVTVGRGTTLTIQPGVTVQVLAGKGIYVDGTLAANGATFTIKDSGNWRGIYLSSDAGASVLNDCTIRAAGADNLGFIHFGYRRAAVYVDSCSPSINNCRFESNAAHGIELYSSRATIRGNSFINVGDGAYAIAFDTTDNWPVLSGNTASGTGIPGIAVPGGNLTGTNTWFKPGANFPYFLNGEITLVEGARLTLEPGVAVKTDAQRFMIYGTLKAVGTAADPILFTSRAASPAPGNWKGLYFGPLAGDSELAYGTVSYAGRDNLGYIHFAYRFAAIYVDGCNPKFSQVTVDQSQWTGFELYGASPRIENSSILNCGAHALRAEAGSRPILSDVVINGNGKSDNGYHAVALEATAVPQPTRVSFANNRLQGVQIWGGSLDTNAVWRNWNAQAPYVVTANTTVGDKVNLTIESGTVVKFQNSGLFVKGVLQADGTAAPIQLTSWRDDAAGGDSNGDGSATSGKDGLWRGLYLSPASGSSVLNNVTFRYGGMDSMDYIHFGYRRTALYVDSCAAKITNCRFLDSAAHGLELYDSTATVQNNVFQNLGDGWYAIAYDTLSVFPTISGNTVSGTGTPGVYLPGGTVTGTNTWNKPGVNFAYYINGELTVAENALLTLDPGVTCKSEGQRVVVSGSLLAKGTPADPVVFTSRKPTPAPGDWPGLYFGPTAGKSDLAHTILDYAGRDSLGYFRFAYRQTAIFVDASNPRFDHLTITNSQYNGLELYAASPTITGSVIANCGRHGLRAEAGSRPSVVDTRFTGNGTRDNGYHVIALEANSVPSPSNVQFASNKLQGVQIWGGTLDKDALWRNWNSAAPYVLTDTATIGDGVRLNIEPGTIVKSLRASLSVRGVLTADGTGNRVTFTSWRDDTLGGDSNGDASQSTPAPGDWKGIYLSPASGASGFTNCTFKFGGGDSLGYLNFAYRYTTLYFDGSSPTVSDCTISDSVNFGIELFSSAAMIRNSVFANIPNNGYAMSFGNLESFPVISGNSATGAGNLGIYIVAGTVSKNGRWSKGGDDFPYLLEGNLTIAESATLALAPGVAIKTQQGIYVNGTLDARGTPSAPILFTSKRAAPSPGDWKGIHFGPQSGSSILRYSQLSYSGGDSLGYLNFGYRYTVLYLENASPELSGLVVSQSGGQGITFYNSKAALNNSLVYSNKNSGIVLLEKAAPQLVNNTIVRNGNSGLDGGNGAPLVANNIIAFNGSDGISSSAGAAVLRNNCVFGNTRTNYSGLSAGTQDLSADPQFVSAILGNYHLSAASPAVNAGDNSVVLASWNDLDGLLRVQSGRVDLGAFEFGSAAAPVIVQAPQSQAVLAGASATFAVTASGTGTLSYQWRKDGNIISGANSATLTLNNVQMADAGAYTVVVSNATGSVTSSPATLTVSTGLTAGGLDSEFNPGTGPDGDVLAMAAQDDGKIVIAGRFTKFNGVSRNGIARLNANGALDTTFDPGLGFSARSNIWSVAIQPDGKILAAGEFITIAGTLQNVIARLRTDGTRDASFNPLFTGSQGLTEGYWLNVRPDGKILVAGWFGGVNGVSRSNIARLNADGSVDNSFDPGLGANDSVSEVQVQSDGNILIGGWFTKVNGVARTHLARLNSNGSLDPSFNPSIAYVADESFVYSLAVQADNRVLAGGWFKNVNGSARNHLVRLNADGSLDTSFDPNAGTDDVVRSLVVEKNGKIWIGGSFTKANGIVRGHIARLNTDGSLDTAFDSGSGANDWVRQVAFYGNDRVLIGGDFTTYDGTPRNRIALIFTEAPSTVPGCQSPPSGLIGWWSGDGAVNDLQGAHPGTLKNSASFAAGKAGQAFSLDGIDDYVDLGGWNAGSQWTIEAWVRPSATPSGRRTIAGAVNEFRDWAITMHDGQFGVAIRTPGGGADTVRSGAQAEAGIWYHVVGTCDGATAKLYLDGALKGSAPVDANYVGTSAGTWIGGESCCGGDNFPGLIDEVSIYNRTLSVTEIQSIFTAGSAGKCKPSSPSGSLAISGKGANQVELWWPTNFGNVVLQSTDRLSDPHQWLDVADLPVSSNGGFSVTLPVAGASRFFRLRTR
jgi:uncharacterized delta-60 repeat protein